jgi:hypothetical protein
MPALRMRRNPTGDIGTCCRKGSAASASHSIFRRKSVTTRTIRWPQGEVGRVGVAIDSIEDMAALFDQIPLERGLDVDDD